MASFSANSLLMTATRERRALIALSMMGSVPDRDYFDELFSDSLDWPWLLMQAMHQRVICCLWENLKRHDLVSAATRCGLTRNWITYTEQLTHANLVRNTLWLSILAETIEAIDRVGIPVACIKGSALIGDIYRPSERMLGDIDTLTAQHARGDIAALLHSRGFRHGTIDPTTGSLQPMSREKIRFWNFHAHLMPKFTLEIGRRDVPFFRFAVGFDFFDPQDAFSVPSEAVLARRVPKTSQMTLSIPNEADMVLNLCIHIYREAVSATFAAAADNWHLGKFGDLRTYLIHHDSAILREGVAARVREFGLESVFFFALHYTQCVYGDPALKPWTQLVDPGPDREFLIEMVDGKRRVTYRRPFEERLFDTRGSVIPGLEPAWRRVMSGDAW